VTRIQPERPPASELVEKSLRVRGLARGDLEHDARAHQRGIHRCGLGGEMEKAVELKVRGPCMVPQRNLFTGEITRTKFIITSICLHNVYTMLHKAHIHRTCPDIGDTIFQLNDCYKEVTANLDHNEC
jgi:hypothetical protein